MSVKDRVHAPSQYPNRAYCGTSDALKTTQAWEHVTCDNCLAAHRADEEARG